ncbi:hypothetical protein D3C81_2001030 [compost metagenome]
MVVDVRRNDKKGAGREFGGHVRRRWIQVMVECVVDSLVQLFRRRGDIGGRAFYF